MVGKMEIKPYVVYLSSSAHSNWREPVKAKYVKNGNVVFVGPCDNHGLSDAMGAPGDVKPGHKLRITQMLNKSDILFGYIPDDRYRSCLLYTSPSPRDGLLSRMPSSA